MASSQLISTLKKASLPLRASKEEAAAPHMTPYVTGLRGVLVISSFLWCFLSVFAPATVSQTDGPTWQHAIRDIFQPILWSPTLIAAFFLILSARTACIPFLSNPCSTTFAGTLIRRSIRVGWPISVATAIGVVIFSTIDTEYFSQFLSLQSNPDFVTPEKPATGLAAVLSIFDLLWVTSDWSEQAANYFFPSGTMWMPSLVYFQSYTVYIMMVILPFTRPLWHIEGLLIFGFGSFWLESWGWYSATGLLIADVAMNPVLKEYLKKGIKVTDNFSLPVWALGALCTIAGLAQKYLWVALFPQYVNSELNLHLTLHTSDANTVANFPTDQPYARVDDWLVVVGVMLLVETIEPLRKLLSAKPLTYLGDRSLSVFTTQSLIFYTVGIKMFVKLTTEHGLSLAGAGAAVLFACGPVIFITAEIFHRLIDLPGRWAARAFFVWVRE